MVGIPVVFCFGKNELFEFELPTNSTPSYSLINLMNASMFPEFILTL